MNDFRSLPGRRTVAERPGTPHSIGPLSLPHVIPKCWPCGPQAAPVPPRCWGVAPLQCHLCSSDSSVRSPAAAHGPRLSTACPWLSRSAGSPLPERCRCDWDSAPNTEGALQGSMFSVALCVVPGTHVP